MDRDEALKLLKGGIERIREWNQRRRADEAIPDLSDADLSDADLSGANLSGANLSGANLSGANLSAANLSAANLSNADLSDADLSNAILSDANLRGANLSDANLRDANLRGANLSAANLSAANLRDANLRGANLSDADLSNADLSNAILRGANLSNAILSDADLSNAILRGANLSNAILSDAILRGGNLSRANLSNAILSDAILRGGNLSRANLSNANLSRANLSPANLSNAILSRANLRGANLGRANLSGANLGKSQCSGTIFASVDLSEVRGLDSINHSGPSTVGIDTLFRSKGKISDAFLRGCGVPERWIEYLPSLIGMLEPIQFYSCFISYSTKNQDFAERLHSKMQGKGLRVWFSPEDIQGGKKLHEQIDEAIRVYDKLLLVLSPESMNSEWVKTEIRKARKAEIKEKGRKLFPIRLIDFKPIEVWELPDSSGEDLAEEVRKFFIPDFSNWKDHDSFESAFARLLRDLKAEESTGAKPG